MSFWSSGSNASQWRGHDYFKKGKVTTIVAITDGIYESYIDGAAIDPYHTVINIAHPKNPIAAA